MSTDNHAITILLVDDEADALEFMKYNLEKEGYTVQTALNGRDGIEQAGEHDPDLIILDVMMPEMDGIEACRELRKDQRFENTIIAFLTARHEDYSQIAGYDSGADDYITKPIKPRLLVSKVKGLLRRLNTEEKSRVLEENGITIDLDRHVVVTASGEELSLPKKEFNLLHLLISKPGRVFTREEILAKVWGTETIVVDRTIDVHIRKLREKLGAENFVTVKGVGYKFGH